MLALLPVPAIEHLASRLRREAVPAGANVVLQGQPGDRVYVVVDGTAEVMGDGRLLATVGPGDAFGEIAVLRDVPRTATVRAATDLDLFTLARDDFLTALGRHQPSSDAAYATVARAHGQLPAGRLRLPEAVACRRQGASAGHRRRDLSNGAALGDVTRYSPGVFVRGLHLGVRIRWLRSCRSTSSWMVGTRDGRPS